MGREIVVTERDEDRLIRKRIVKGEGEERPHIKRSENAENMIVIRTG
jgi:hypothetical protein